MASAGRYRRTQGRLRRSAAQPVESARNVRRDPVRTGIIPFMGQIIPPPKPDSQSSYANRMKKVIRYIEAHLDSDLPLAKLSDVANFSPFHFHRQFREYTGISVARLVRLLRLKRASIQLAFNPQMSITAIALEAGYGRPESFSRAFREAYDVSPRRFREAPEWRARQVKPIAHVAEQDMNREVELVDFPTTRIAAVEYQGPEQQAYSGVMQLVAWRRENGVRPDHGRTYGIHFTDPTTTPPENFRLDIGVSYEQDIPPNEHGVMAKVIPGGRCACVRHHGSRDYIPEAEYLYREWLPRSGEELRDFPIFFHYVNVGPDVLEADMITDIYLPLK